ncbi:putative leader peptide [Streptomyces cirratus]|uniref:putative leader peptide n=1 Tax=Streptomyces cirratus TaxID=68187 RepID=UPI0035716721
MVHHLVTLLGRVRRSANMPTNQVGKLGIREAAMRSPHRTGRTLPLTSRRHIDLGRTSSAICQPA